MLKGHCFFFCLKAVAVIHKKCSNVLFFKGLSSWIDHFCLCCCVSCYVAARENFLNPDSSIKLDVVAEKQLDYRYMSTAACQMSLDSDRTATFQHSCTKKINEKCYFFSLRVCSIFPLYSVTSVETKQNKSSGRNGSTFDFLCRCRMGAEGWAGVRCGRRRALRVFCRVFTCPVRGSWCCVCASVSERVLECGLTFRSDTTSDIRSPLRGFTLFWRVSQNAFTVFISTSSLRLTVAQQQDCIHNQQVLFHFLLV